MGAKSREALDRFSKLVLADTCKIDASLHIAHSDPSQIYLVAQERLSIYAQARAHDTGS